MRDRGARLLLVAMTCLALIVACTKDEDVMAPTPQPPGDDPPITPDVAVAAFKSTFEAMDLSGYRDLLSPDFTFVLQPATVAQFGLPDSVLAFAEDVAIQDHMFSGAPGSTGKRITSISIAQLQPQGVWTDVPDTDPYFGSDAGAVERLYDVTIDFYVQGEDLQYHVHGWVKFVVTAQDVASGDGVTTTYRLSGQVDLTDAKGVEVPTLGDMKALYM